MTPAPLIAPATERVPEAVILVHASDCNVDTPFETFKAPVATVNPPVMLAPPLVAVKLEPDIAEVALIPPVMLTPVDVI